MVNQYRYTRATEVWLKKAIRDVSFIPGCDNRIIIVITCKTRVIVCTRPTSSKVHICFQHRVARNMFRVADTPFQIVYWYQLSGCIDFKIRALTKAVVRDTHEVNLGFTMCIDTYRIVFMFVSTAIQHTHFCPIKKFKKFKSMLSWFSMNVYWYPSLNGTYIWNYIISFRNLAVEVSTNQN